MYGNDDEDHPHVVCRVIVVSCGSGCVTESFPCKKTEKMMRIELMFMWRVVGWVVGLFSVSNVHDDKPLCYSSSFLNPPLAPACSEV
jgi:hypothetical protein